MFKAFHARQGDGAHYAAVTDPGSSLEALADEGGFRRVFHGDPDIGGRYSALSAFGLVPAAAAGIDVGAVLDRRSARPRSAAPSRATPASGSACALGELAVQGRDKLTFVADAPLSSYGLWAEQLVRRVDRQAGRAASCRSPTSRSSTPRAYGGDRVFVHISLGDGVNARRLAALREAGHPVVTIRALGPADLGRIFFLSRVRHRRRRLGARDQPVRPAERARGQGQHQPRAQGRARPDLHGRRPRRPDRGPRSRRTISRSWATCRTPKRPTPPSRACEPALIERHHVATTWGYGPRFLHSTGQFHKGGPKAGRFLQLIDEPADDLEVPGEPFTFGTLIRAQADGDLQTLRDHGLPAVRVVVGDIDADHRSSIY